MKSSICTWFGAAIAVVAVSASGCGGDEEKAERGGDDAGAGGATGSGGSGPASGGATGTGGAPTAVLDDDKAGAACADNAACGPRGTCAAVLTAGAIGSVLGASAPTTGGYCTGECSQDAECGRGGICFAALPNPLLPIAGECRKACETSTDCRDGYECAAQNAAIDIGGTPVTVPKTCQPAPFVDRLTDQVGKACDGADAGSVCGDGFCATGGNTPLPGGYCTGGCTQDGDCGQDGICVVGFYGTQGACWERCTADTDCARDADGYGCVTLGSAQVCGPEQEPLPADIVGGACATNAACAPGVCVRNFPAAQFGAPPLPAPGGYCSLENCGNDEACGPGGHCIIGGLATMCADGCATSADCRSGYVCEARGLFGAPPLVCVPGTAGDGGTPPDGGGPTEGGTPIRDASAG